MGMNFLLLYTLSEKTIYKHEHILLCVAFVHKVQKHLLFAVLIYELGTYMSQYREQQGICSQAYRDAKRILLILLSDFPRGIANT